MWGKAAAGLNRLIPNIFTGNVLKLTQSELLHNSVTSASGFLAPTSILQVFTRNKIRQHFTRPSERKRILRHGWKQRMSTAAGRRILMNRILKGRWVYSH